MTTKHSLFLSLCVLALALPLLAACKPARAGTETVVHLFTGYPTDGFFPSSGLIGDSAGNGYGTTSYGGAYSAGTVYKITPAGQETVIYSFGGNLSDGQRPDGEMTRGKDGNLYGTTYIGGAAGEGTVYKITPAGQETVLYSFQSGSDGANPIAGLIQAKDGSFYGTTYYGGTAGDGTVFKITSAGQETVLHSFGADASDGINPYASVTQAKDGNFYGTTEYGGADSSGTVYKITASGQETVLHTFNSTNGDGYWPYAGVIQASDGSLYGTAYQGGASFQGMVYKITLSGQETILYSFKGLFFGDGDGPIASMIQSKDGNFYGTTFVGGRDNEGMVYKITPTGQETNVYSFTGNAFYPYDGSDPESPLVQDKSGYLYGSSSRGGPHGGGAIYRITI